MSQDLNLVEHYGGGGLLAAIEAGLAKLGKSSKTATVEDLGPVDEFHIGGRSATVELSQRLDVSPGTRLLDVGCGIGGTSRFFASTTGCQVTGIDLSPTYVDVARTLTEWTGLSDQVAFEAGSALEMPFANESFDRAVQLHVGMNIDDKAALFAEIARTLRPGGRLAVYDILRVGAGDLEYPVPWASDTSQSFVGDPEDYRTSLEAAGFEVDTRDRRQFAMDFFAAQAARATGTSGPPPLGLHLIIGADTPTKLGNLRSAIDAGTLAPVEFICSLK
ncbi:MAG: SAM-dependent methyltransferase [Candidatus Poriferisodalaceae bacterium]|jgi:SAM-dependent methyltransferase